MRIIKSIVFAIAVLVGLNFVTDHVSAGPLINSELGQVFKQGKVLLIQMKKIQAVLSQLQKEPREKNIPITLKLLNKFQTGLTQLIDSIENLKEVGKIVISDAEFLKIELNTAKEIIDSLIEELSKSPPVLEHINTFVEARRHIKNAFRWRPDPRPPINLAVRSPIFSQISSFTLHGQLVVSSL
ncbi:hypothetical protein HY009_00505, partial [Candidatus Acetothermia bacterium]|nr:hypothetical protein [Candidatus Acetothermia bacterium]